MANKTRLIEFDYEKYKAGAKPVFKNTNNIFLSLHTMNGLRLLVVYQNIEQNEIFSAILNGNGKSLLTCEWPTDLYLEEEIEENTLYINIYKDNSGQNTDAYTYYTLEEAKENNGGQWFKGTLKVTYTDEDLIK